MSCTRPLQGFVGLYTNPETNKSPIVFNSREAYRKLDGTPIFQNVPCGWCQCCRLYRSLGWAIRIQHEIEMLPSESCCFITLTYNDTFLPEDSSLVHRDFQLFMKAFRRKHGEGIRFFMAGEYGSKFGRPHYHAIIINYFFDDLEFLDHRNGYDLFRSKELESLWIDRDHGSGLSLGYSSVGAATFKSAAYVARYILKKSFGEDAIKYFQGYNWFKQIPCEIKPEYTAMSRRPGIGKEYYEEFKHEIYGTCQPDSIPGDISVGSRTYKAPRFYDDMFQIENEEVFALLKERRRERAMEAVEGMDLLQQSYRRIAKEKLAEQRVAKLKRELE